MATDNIHSIGVVNRFTGPPYISYIYNKQCWVISIINNVSSVISPWFLQPIRTPCHVKMIFWGPSNAFMRREIKNTELRPASALFFVWHFINCFHTFENTTVKTNIFVWKTLYFFSKSKVLPRSHVQLVSLSVAKQQSNKAYKSLRHLHYIKYQFQTKIYLNKNKPHWKKEGFISRNSQLFLTYPRNSSGGRQIIIWRPPDNLSLLAAAI